MILLQVHRSSRIKLRYAGIVVLCFCAVCLVLVLYWHAHAVNRQIAALKDSDEGVRMDAAQKLGELKDPRAVEPLIATLKDSDKAIRWVAAGALGKIGAPAVEPLIAALKDPDEHIRGYAAGALGKIEAPRAVEPLIAALKDENWEVRESAGEALGKIGDPRAVEPLIAALKDENWEVRESAGEALGEINDPRAREAVLSQPPPPPPPPPPRPQAPLRDLGVLFQAPPPPPPRPRAPKRVRIGGQVEAARLIFQVRPEYPPLAKAARIQGVVKLDAVISKDGTIQDLKVISGHPILVRAALDAVQRWRYQSTLVNGEAVEVATEIDVNFALEQQAEGPGNP